MKERFNPGRGCKKTENQMASIIVADLYTRLAEGSISEAEARVEIRLRLLGENVFLVLGEEAP